MMKKNDVGFVFVIVVSLVVILGLGFLFYYKLSNPRSRFEILIGNFFDYIQENSIKNQPKRLKGEVSVQLYDKSTYRDFSDEDKDVPKDSFVFSYGMDYEKKQGYFKVNKTFFKDEKEMGGSILLKNGNAYVYLQDKDENYLKVPLSSYDSYFRKDTFYDYRVVSKSIENSLIHSLNDQYFEKEYVTMDSKRILKSTLILNQNNYQKLKQEVLRRLLKDSKFLNSLANITHQEKKKISQYIDRAMIQNQNDFEGKIIFYTMNDRFIQLEIQFDQEAFLLKRKGIDQYSFQLLKSNQVIYDGESEMVKDGNQSTIKFFINDNINKSSKVVKILVNTIINESEVYPDVHNFILYSDLSEEEKNEDIQYIRDTLAFDFLREKH